MDILNKTNIQNKILRAPEFGEETGGGGASSTPSNAVFIGGVEVDKFYLGNSDDIKIFLGDVKLYPRDISYKLVAKYSDSSEYKIECDDSTALTQSMVEAHTTAKSAMTSAVVSACGHSTFKIGNLSFKNCTSLSSITLDDNITEIGSEAFMYCSGLTSFHFPTKLTQIQSSAFRYANKIKNISGIPSGVTYLSSGCFADMSGLSAATIPSSVTGSSTNLFLRDTALKEVHFKRTTAPALGADAFNGCTSLTKIYIPNCNCLDSYAAQSQFSGKTNIIYAEGTTTRCVPYTLLSYIKKDSSHIGNVNLGINLPSNFKIEISVRPTSNNGGLLIGDTSHSTDTNDFRFFGNGTQPHFDIKDKRIYYNSSNSFVTTGRTYTVTLTNFKMVLKTDGQADRTVSSATVSLSDTYHLYAFRNQSGDYAQIYYIKVYSGNTLVGDFVPILTDAGKYTMLNKVNNTICSTSGTLTGG